MPRMILIILKGNQEMACILSYPDTFIIQIGCFLFFYFIFVFTFISFVFVCVYIYVCGYMYCGMSLEVRGQFVGGD